MGKFNVPPNAGLEFTKSKPLRATASEPNIGKYFIGDFPRPHTTAKTCFGSKSHFQTTGSEVADPRLFGRLFEYVDCRLPTLQCAEPRGRCYRLRRVAAVR